MSIAPIRPSRTWNPDGKESAEERRAHPFPPEYRRSQDGKPSLDITQKLERKLAQLNTSENVFKRWIYEITTCAISALCMGGIIGILLCLNNRSLNKWPTGLTIYTVLSKIASAALILPISEALGQLKWDWFNGKKSKEIWDFEIFDKASRGAWGSVLLLFRTKGKSLAALGAILTVLLIANDTFFQRVIELPERWSLEQSLIPRISRITKYDPEITFEVKGGTIVAQQDQHLRPSLMQYFYGNGTRPLVVGNGTQPEIPISCPASNCTFPEFETLGVCSQCADVSELLQFGCKETRVDWIRNLTGTQFESAYPNGTVCGYFFNITSNVPVLMSGYSATAVESSAGTGAAGEALLFRALPLVTNPMRQTLWGGSIKFKHLRNSISDGVTVAASASGVYRNETPIAQECVLSWCVKRIRASYHGGDYEENVLSTFTNSTPGPHPFVTKTVESLDVNGTWVNYTENIVITSSADGQVYGVDREIHTRVYNIFDDLYPSFVTVANLTADPIFRYKSYTNSPVPYYRQMKFNPWLSPNSITRHMDRMATTMSNLLRSSANNEMIVGSAYNLETYVSIQWAWLTFPFSLLLLTLIFLVATIMKTSNADDKGLDVWKTSAMPTLISSLPGELQKQFIPRRGTDTSSGGVPNIRIRLHPTKGWRVSGQPYSPDAPVMVVRPNQAPPGWI